MAAALAAALVVAVAQPASADWFQQNTPYPPSSTGGLAGVSCPSAHSCVAVGNFSESAGSNVLVEVLDGSTWTIQNAPSPSGAASSQLTAVSCSTPTACTAVGSLVTSASATLALVEHWNGASWTIQTFPTPAGSTGSQLDGVACSSSTACTAVGSSVNGSGNDLALIAAWNGTSWKLQRTPRLAGDADQGLQGVACTSPGACTAVGSYLTGEGATVTLAEVSTNGRWAVQRTVNRSGTTVSELDAVSCPSAGVCTAVGAGMAERRSGSTWTLERVPRPQGSTSGAASLSGVSCTSASACSAVGSFYYDGVESPVAAVWDGTHWSLQDTPLDTSYDTSYLEAVSCRTAAVSCIAVGTYHDPNDGYRTWAEAFALRWQPENVNDPPGSIASDLHATWCSSPSACMAVGDDENVGGTFAAFAEMWDGSYWITLATPHAASSSLSGVSCTSASACTAVGDVVSGSTIVSLAERWNGTAWRVQHTPKPAGSSQSYLSAVSCSSATTCMAVGQATKASGRQVTLAESWNGHIWSVRPTPDSSASSNDTLTAVSCASPKACIAVGASNTGKYRALTEIWDGTKWKTLRAPVPAGGSDSYLSGVSCSTASACTAVGSYFNGQRSVPLSEHRDGGSWTSDAVAVPHGSSSSGLSAVSCVSATDCAAVGYEQMGDNLDGLAEHWAGRKWSGQPVAVPPGSQRTYLQSVSCPSMQTCTASGAVDDSTGNEDVLVELYA